MDVIIQGHDIRVNDALEDYTRKKLDKLDRYLPNIREVRVDLAHQHTRRGEDLVTAQITVSHKRGAILRSEERAPGDVNAAINAAVEKMFRRVQRFKGKRSRKGRERFSASIEELNVAENIPDVEEYADEEGSETVPPPDQVIRRKPVAVSAMNESEAIEQMELLGHTFFVFFNDATGSVNVLYKRTAGGYGLLIPQVE